MRNLLKEGTVEEEQLCKEMVEIGYNYLIKKLGYDKPRSWAFGKMYLEQVEHYIMEQSIPGTYNSTMIKIAADHATFIADYGWDKYAREIGKPQDITNAHQFFYDGTFDDYDPKNVEIKDPFETLKNDEDDFGELFDEVDVEIYDEDFLDEDEADEILNQTEFEQTEKEVDEEIKNLGKN